MQHRPGSLPAYLRIAERLARDIAAGRLADGMRLPPEREMAPAQGVAVGTLRKALAELRLRGLITSRQGSGNYIRAMPDSGGIYALFRLERVEGGGLPGARVMSVDRLHGVEAPRRWAVSGAHRIRRLRYIDDLPVAVEEIWLDGSLTPVLSADDLSESLYLFYRQRLGLAVTWAEDRIGMDALSGWAPAEFGLAPGHPLPCIDRVARDTAGRVIEMSRTWFDAERARYVARHGQASGEIAAEGRAPGGTPAADGVTAGGDTAREGIPPGEHHRTQHPAEISGKDTA